MARELHTKQRVMHFSSLAFSLHGFVYLFPENYYEMTSRGTANGDMRGKKTITDRDPLQSLSPREREVLKWLSCGKTSWAISVILRISERTVNFHVNNIMRKLGVCSRMQAVSVTANNDEDIDERQ